MKRKCCGQGTITSTDDDHIPLGKLVHAPGHFISKGFWASQYIVRYSPFSVANGRVAKGRGAFLHASAVVMPSSPFYLRDRTLLMSYDDEKGVPLPWAGQDRSIGSALIAVLSPSSPRSSIG